MKKGLVILAVGLLVGVGVLVGLYQWASRDIPPPDESFFIVERPVVAPEDNAYTYFLQATNRLQLPEQSDLMTKYRNDMPVDEAAIQALLESNAECLALIQRGTDYSICQVPPVEDFQTSCPYISPWLKIATVNDVRARKARLSGDYRTAADACILEMEFGTLILENPPSLIVYLVGAAIVDMGLTQILALATDPGTPVEELDRLAAALQNPISLGRGLSRAIKGEYVYSASIINYMRDNTGNLSSLFGSEGLPPLVHSIIKRFRRSNYFFQPNKSKQLFADFYRNMSEDASRHYSEMDLPDTVEDSGGFWMAVRPNSISRFLQALLEPAVEKVMLNKCFFESRVAGAKLVVACNRFEREKGYWPEKLQELVPDFLDAVPMDPFDGEPCRYIAEKGIVYSVGQNLTDEGGSTMTPDGKGKDETGWRRKNAEDLVFGLMAR